MKRNFSIKSYYDIDNLMDNSDEVTKDVAREVTSELFNPAYLTDEERINGILKAIEFVTEIKISAVK